MGLAVIAALGQTTAPDAAKLSLPAGMTRAAGKEATSGIEYALITMQGKLVGGLAAASPAAAPVPGKLDPAAPRLTAQCTRTPAGRFKFELRENMGGLSEPVFYAPWKQTKEEQFPPPLQGVTVTMDFLGYTRVKPVKRAWRYLREEPGEMRYDTPGMQSSNMEDVVFYMQYLKALPTLRLTLPPRDGKKVPVIAEFETSQWQQVVRKEPLCHASAL